MRGVTMGSGPLSPAWLLSRMRSLHGANLIALGEGSGLTLSGSNVTGWTALLGANLTAAGSGYYTKALSNGRYGMATASNTGKWLKATVGAYKAVTIATAAPTTPFTRTTVGVTGNVNTQIVGLSGAGSSLATGAGRTVYVNEAITTTVASGFQVISCAIPAATDTVFYLGSYSSGASDWMAQIEIYACYASAPTDAQLFETSRIMHAFARK